MIDAEASQRFVNLANRWRSETVFVSSMKQVTDHPACREIVAMGWAVVSLLLERLSVAPSYHWIIALREITGDGPTIAPDEAGRLRVIAAKWIAYGHDNGWLDR